MQAASFILAACALAAGNAASIPRQNTITNSHLANFRTWGSPGCSADNQGEYNFEMFDLNICFQFPVTITAKSIMVENIATGDDIVCSGEIHILETQKHRPSLSLTNMDSLRLH